MLNSSPKIVLHAKQEKQEKIIHKVLKPLPGAASKLLKLQPVMGEFKEKIRDLYILPWKLQLQLVTSIVPVTSGTKREFHGESFKT